LPGRHSASVLLFTLPKPQRCGFFHGYGWPGCRKCRSNFRPRHGWPGCRKCRSNFRRTTDGTPPMQKHFPALQRTTAGVAPKAAPMQEIAAAMTSRSYIPVGSSRFDYQISIIVAGPPLHRCNSFLRQSNFLGHRCSIFLERSSFRGDRCPGFRCAASGLRRSAGGARVVLFPPPRARLLAPWRRATAMRAAMEVLPGDLVREFFHRLDQNSNPSLKIKLPCS